MDDCLDIHLRPDPEMSESLLMNSLFAKLHRQLVAHKPLQIGMSFPDYSADLRRLGCVMRLHGMEENLQSLMMQDWLGGLRGYLQLTAVRPVVGNRFVRVRRVQTKSNLSRLARRFQVRHGVSEEDALARYASVEPQFSSLPYIVVKSASNEQTFRLFVRQDEAESRIPGKFSCYALSREATLACP